ncbi:hypothetical protein BTO04_09320 [Polaribacter sp. SA4-10]|uniref:hypothetical protein n=1 Tax=Polaribacter sp. SA4-10 TaxID=754397 RepID=UPI000B3BE98F|nr:hypothetical protein [Polaribacter sp. SA4-10]ARV06869.1 hypothetical protein BTO04_09320 [Polaribacter sp. SA4-10]
MKYLIIFFSITMFFGCKSQEYQLVDKPILILKEGFYVEIPPAIVEGFSSVKATLKFQVFDKEKIELLGFYFRNNYILMKEVLDPYAIEGSVQKKSKEDVDQKNTIPFNLESYEVVLSYKYLGNLKYAKFKVKRKVSFDDVPR